MPWYQYIRFQISQWKEVIFLVLISIIVLLVLLFVQNRSGGQITWEQTPVVGTVSGVSTLATKSGHSTKVIYIKLSSGEKVSIKLNAKELPLIVKGETIKLRKGENRHGFEHYRLVDSQ